MVYAISNSESIPAANDFKKATKDDNDFYNIGQVPKNKDKVYIFVKDENGNIESYAIPQEILKIVDTEGPKITDVKVASNIGDFNFSNHKKGFDMTIIASDEQSGLALKAYAVVKLEEDELVEEKVKQITDNSFKKSHVFSFKKDGDFNESGNYLIVVRDCLGNISYTTKTIVFDETAPVVGTAHSNLFDLVFDKVDEILGFTPIHEETKLTITVPIHDTQIGVDQNNTKLILKDENGDLIETYAVSSKDKENYVFDISISDFIKDKTFKLYIATQDLAGNQVIDKEIAYVSNEKIVCVPILVDNNAPTVTHEKIDVDVIQNDGKDCIKENATITYLISDIVENTTCSGIHSIQTKVNGVEKTVDLITDKKVESQTITIDTSHYTVDKDDKFNIEIIVIDNAGNETVFTRTVYLDTKAPDVGVATLKPTPVIDNEKIDKLGYVPFNADTIEVKVPITDNLSGVDKDNTKLTIKGEREDIQYEVSSVDKSHYIFNINAKDDLLQMYVSTKDRLGNPLNEHKLKYEINSKEFEHPILIDMNDPTVTDEKIDVEVKHIGEKDWIKENATITYLVSDIVENTICSGIHSIQTKVNGVEKTVDVKTDEKVENQTITIKTEDYKVNKDGSYQIKIEVIDNAGNKIEFPRKIYRDIYLDTKAPDVGVATLNLTPKIDNDAIKTLGYVPFDANTIQVKVPIKDDLSGIDDTHTKLIIKDGKNIIKTYDLSKVKDEDNYVCKIDVKDQLLPMYVSTKDQLGNSVDEQRLEYQIKSDKLNLPILLETNVPTVSNEKINTPVTQLGNKDWIGQNTTVSYLISDFVKGTICSGIKSIDLTINGVKQVVSVDKTQRVENQTITINTAQYTAHNDGSMVFVMKIVDNAGNEYTFNRTIYVDLDQPQFSISYDNNKPDQQYTHVYNANRTATLTMKEINFDASLLNIKVSEDGIIRTIKPTWSLIAGKVDTTSATYQAKIDFSKNVDYILTIDGKDKVGHSLNKNVNDSFTVDKINPKLSLSYDNNKNTNGNYYAAYRTATIRIEEHNFDPSRLNIIGTATDNNKQVAFPHLSTWKTSGDVHTATLSFNRDAYYKLDFEYHDKAGNSISDFAMQDFYVDTTVPKIDFSGVVKNSTNSGSITPSVHISDTNYDNNGVAIKYSGAHRGTLKFDGSKKSSGNGEIYTFANLTKKKVNDDVYTIHVSVKDKAGNSSEADIVYSVNRFGSTYQMSDNLSKILNNKYIQNCNDIVFSEINVNTIKNVVIKLSINGQIKELKQGQDYTIRRTNEKSWNRYIYTINGSLFDSDGIYQIIVTSVDMAGNVNENIIDSKKANIVFTVDKTAPTVAISGVENNGIYNTNMKNAQILAEDNIVLSKLEVYLNSQLLPLKDNQFNPTIDIPESNSVQTLQVFAYDKAGNKYQTELMSFTVSTNFFVRLYMNKPLFFGSIAAIVAVIGGAIFIIFKKKNKKDEKTTNETK